MPQDTVKQALIDRLHDLSPTGCISDQFEVLVISTERHWAMCATLTEAWKRAWRPKHYNVFIVHKDATVSPIDGSINSPDGFRPWLIKTTVPKKRAKKVAA